MSRFEQDYMGRGPTDIYVHLIGDLILVRLKGVLTAAERHLVQTLPSEKGPDLLKHAEGAAKVQQFHRQLFLSASDTLRKEIKRITGMEVREATAEVEPQTGAVVQVFTSGTMVQVFFLSGKLPSDSFNGWVFSKEIPMIRFLDLLVVPAAWSPPSSAIAVDFTKHPLTPMAGVPYPIGNKKLDFKSMSILPNCLRRAYLW
jgi:uncharacterized protein YbcI